jgi:small subunit ribosomal protein S21
MLRDGESPEALLRRFRKKVQRAGVLRDARKKRWFMSKSEQRRIAKRKAIRRHRKRQWRQNNRNR